LPRKNIHGSKTVFASQTILTVRRKAGLTVEALFTGH